MRENVVDPAHGVKPPSTVVDFLKHPAQFNSMSQTHWHLRITLESSAKAHVEQLAQAERRSAANYVRVMIEKQLQEKPQ